MRRMTNEHLKWIKWGGGGECPVDPKAYVYVRYFGGAVGVGPLQAGLLTWKERRHLKGKIVEYAEVREIVHTVRNA